MHCRQARWDTQCSAVGRCGAGYHPGFRQPPRCHRAVRHRLPEDWTVRYNITPVLIETFVETPRYTSADTAAWSAKRCLRRLRPGSTG